MDDLRIEDYLMPAADLGVENPMPDIGNVTYIHATFNTADTLSDDEKKNIGKGTIDTILPYLIRDGYDRKLTNRKFKSIVLENDYLKATFLPEVGGRLWSLFDKKEQKELLYVNKIFQPCNLAIRNAWFSGGIEFNVGIRGHNPLTCEPMFAAFSKDKNGVNVLSLYEYERKRGLVYSVNARIIKDRLFLTTVVENLSEKPQYMYWWTNIAVNEKGVRVFAPAESAFVVEYGDDKYSLTKKPMPNIEGIDSSYPEHFTHSGDLFYDIPNHRLKWECAIGEDGYGLMQYSTCELTGRKVFFWGNGRGGERWNEFLSNDNKKYIEIQAGYLKTQMEHTLMPANTTWQWTEAYRAFKMEKSVLTGNWNKANEFIENEVKKEYDLGTLDFSIPENKSVVFFGSGWGAFESRFRKISNYFDFPIETMDSRQHDWINLFDKGYVEKKAADYIPQSYYISESTLKRLENSLQSNGRHYLTYLYIGVVKYALGDKSGAFEAFKKSVEIEPNMLAYRNLAMMYKNVYNDKKNAIEYILKAYDVGDKRSVHLLKDCGYVLTSCGADGQWIKIAENLPKQMRKSGRIGLYLTIAYINEGKYKKASEILNESFEMDDIKEGEISVSAIWDELYRKMEMLGEKYIPLPEKLDFRMV